MRFLTIHERDRVGINTDPNGLTEPEAAELRRLSHSLPSGMLTWEHQAVRFGQYCGVVRVGELTIEVLPKTSGNAEGDTRGVLVAMLEAAGFLAESRSTASIAMHASNLLDVFLLDFCDRINGLLRRGAIRTYEAYEDNLSCVRGRLNLREHLRRNLLDRGHIHCRFDELTIDNRYNRFLKAVLRLLLTQAAGSAASGPLNSLLLRLEDVSRAVCSLADLNGLQFTRTSAPWRPVFEQAGLLLRHLYPDVQVGSHKGPGLLFDMERLFEAFVGAKLRRQWRSAPEYRVHLHGPQRYFGLGRNGPAFRMIPDISVLGSADTVERLYDAKWKILDWQAPSRGIERGDLYQMAAYAARYDCDWLALIYPSDKAGPREAVDEFVLQCAGAPRIVVYALDLVSLVYGGSLPKGLGPAEDE